MTDCALKVLLLRNLGLVSDVADRFHVSLSWIRNSCSSIPPCMQGKSIFDPKTVQWNTAS